MRRRLTVAVCISAFLAITGFAIPATGGPIRTARHRYSWCRHKLGPHPCGRNIIRYGWKEKGKKAKVASRNQIIAWSKRLHLLTHPPRLLRVHGRPPRLPTGNGASTASYNPTGRAACIVHAESGGNPQAVNGQYHGIAQWSSEAWGRMGGHRYASDPLGATRDQQLVVLSDGLAHYGCRDWCPYDGC